MKTLKALQKAISEKSLLEHLIFLILALFAMLFYKERLLADSSYYLFRLVNEERFIIEHGRHILFFSQIFAFIALKLKLSLKAILLFYSLGHIVFFYGVFLIGKYQFKAPESGWMVILMQILGIMSGFFVPMFEMYYSASLLLLFYFILFYSRKKYKIIPLLVLAYFIICGHFYAILLLGIVLLYHFSSFKWKNWKTYLAIGVLVVVYMFIKREFATPYEIGKSKAFINNLQNANYHWGYIKNLTAFLISYYWAMLVLLITTLVILITKKEYYPFIILLGSFIVLLAMVNVSYYGFDPSRYQEQVYFPLTFLVGFSFVKYVFIESKFWKKNAFIILLVGISIFRLILIFEEGIRFNARINEMTQYINVAEQKDGCKFIVDEEQLKYHANWSWPIESLLFSSMNTDTKSLSIATLKDLNYSNNKENLSPEKYMFRRYEIYNLSDLNQNYFSLCKSEYEFLEPILIR